MKNADNNSNKVFQLLEAIPAGKVVSYGQIAEILGFNPRRVGNILHRNPDPGKFPCHRVVRSDGSIAAGYAFGGMQAQIDRLRSEGVEIQAGKIKNLEDYLFHFDT